MVHVDERVNVAGRQGNDRHVLVALGDIRRYKSVDCPGLARILHRAELLSHQVDHLARIGQPRDGVAVEQIQTQGANTARLEPAAGVIVGETAGGQNFERLTSLFRRAFGQHGERRSHLAARTKDQQRTG